MTADNKILIGVGATAAIVGYFWLSSQSAASDNTLSGDNGFAKTFFAISGALGWAAVIFL
jgi:hypothetical protein